MDLYYVYIKKKLDFISQLLKQVWAKAIIIIITSQKSGCHASS